jgi:ABC-type multidrug transport system fused ATPase/permease subunit
VWDFLTLCGVVSVLLLGAGRVLTGDFSVSELIMFLGYLTLLIGPMGQISYAVTVFCKNAAGLEDLLLQQSLVNRPRLSADTPVRQAKCTEGVLRFEDVGFCYPNSSRNVLSNVHCEFHPGEIVAISGESGAGKSTLVRLLLRCYEPTQGRITIQGVDVRSVSMHAYRQLFGFVDQEVVLFSGTIAENIAFGAVNATRDEVSAAAALAACNFIQDLPNGLDSRLGEDGIQLSGGQRQRIALARALMRNPRIIVLDEPTSQLDEAVEAEVYENLFCRLRDRTVILITHRPSVVARANRVLDISNGRLTTLVGLPESPDELMRQCA